MKPIRSISGAIALAVLGACAPVGGGLGSIGEPRVTRLDQTAPPGAQAGTCWGKNVTPAIIETVTRQVRVQPARVKADGTVAQPAVYRTETRQDIVRERSEFWFRTPCPALQTPEFIGSVQRALQARGFYRGAITGKMDPRTRAAVRRYQKPQGLDSGILSLAAARSLGLVAVETAQDDPQ